MLYEDQLEAARKAEDWLNNDNTLSCGLWASAGFGKSWMTKHLIEEVVLGNSNYIPLLTSMTHSAVDVLKDFTGMDVTTLHSLMGWVPMVNRDTGEEYLSTPESRKDSKRVEPLNSQTLLIIDEAGLMGSEQLKLVQNTARMVGARILFVGDHKQCYPVDKDVKVMSIPAYEASDCYLDLTIPKRVDEGDMIYKLSQAYRKSVDGGTQPKLKTMLNTDGSGKGVRHVDDIEEWAYKAFKAGVRDGNTANIKVLAFTNDRCLNLNRKIRKNVMGLTDPCPIVGELMVSNTSITDATNENILIRNNQMLKVATVERTVSYGLEGAMVQYVDEDGEPVEEIVFVPSSPSALKVRLHALATEAKEHTAEKRKDESKLTWQAFFSLKDSVADIRYTYAMTINKSQGTTLKHVLIDLWDVSRCKDKGQAARLAYTAVTRATDYVTIEGQL